MDFSVLSRYDDILADYFVDNLYLWYNTLRMNGDFVGTNVDKREAVEILREHVIFGQNSSASLKSAVEAFLLTSYFQEYTKNFESKQLVEFNQHMKRYLIMYRHNAGFEVGSTTRYTGKPEACLIATKAWNTGEQVTCCLGSIAALSEQDDLKLKSEGRDFSVMVSTRKKCSCLFLGPARFMNHDCDSNCEFILIGQNAITFRVVKDIMVGEEMTVFYADHYFGEGNCECMCVSCERMQEGHFSTSKSSSASPNESDAEQNVQNDNSGSRRSGRKRKEISYKDYYVPEQVKRPKPLPSESTSNTNVKPMVEITNVLPKDKKDESPLTLDDRKLGTRKVDSIPFENQIVVEAQQPRNRFIFRESNNRLKRAVSAPPAFNFTCESSIKHMNVTQSCTDKGPENDMELETFKEWLDNLSDLSDEESSDTPEVPKEVELTCCDNWKEYCMSRVSEEPELCGRCNRHFQIYGMQWPIRRIKPICPRLKNKGILAIEGAPRSASPSPSPIPEKAPSPSCSPKNHKWKLSQPSAPPIRYKMAVRLASVNGLKKLKPKPLVPSAASYETDPVIINARASNLSIPNIHTNNLPVQHKLSERSLVIEMEDKLTVTRPFKMTTRENPYHPICLHSDILDRQSQLSKLEERQRDLLQLRDRLHHAIYSQRQNEETSASILYIPTPDSGTPQPDDLEKINENLDIDIVDIQQENCKADGGLEVIRSDSSINVVRCNEDSRHIGETPPSLDERSDTASPASITTPNYNHTSYDKNSVQHSSEKQESTLPSTVVVEESQSISSPTLDDPVTETDPTSKEGSSTKPASLKDGNERHMSPETEIIDVESIYDESFTTPTTHAVRKERPENNPHIVFANNGYEETSTTISEQFIETASKSVVQKSQSKIVATHETINSVNCTEVEQLVIAEDGSNPVISNDLNDTQKRLSPNIYKNQSVQETHQLPEMHKIVKTEDSDKQQEKSASSSVKNVAVSIPRKTSINNLSQPSNSTSLTDDSPVQSEVTPAIAVDVSCGAKDISLQGKGKEEDTPNAIFENPGEVTPVLATIPATTQVKREDINGPNSIGNVVNEDYTSYEKLCENEQTEIADPPSPTFTEVLEYAVSPKSTSLDDLPTTPSADKVPVVKQEIVEETPRLRGSSNTLWRRRSKRTAAKKKADESDNFSSNRVEAPSSSNATDASSNTKVTLTKPLDFKSMVNSKRPVVQTSMIPDLCNILYQPPSSNAVQPPVNFSALMNNGYQSSVDYQIQEQRSFMNTIAALRAENTARACDIYHTISRDNAQKGKIDHSCNAPSFEHIVSQNHYENNSSNSHSSYSLAEDGRAVKKEYDPNEAYRTMLQTMADQERPQRPPRKQSNQPAESFATYPALPSFQDIVSNELPPYIYPLMEEYRSTYAEPGYTTPSTTSSTALAVVSLISQGREQSNTTIPQTTHIPRYDSIARESPVQPQQRSSNLKGKSTMHFTSRPSDTASPSPVPQQPPMKVSFLLQADANEKCKTENSDVKTEANQRIPDAVGIQKRVSPRTRAKEESKAKMEKPATTLSVPKAPAPAPTPKKTPPKTSAPKRKARVGCPIAPPQRDPPLSAEMVKKTLRLKKYNGIDLLNPFVPRIVPAPSLTSMSAQYNRSSSSKPYIPNGPDC